jgi:hypothetical protein
MSQPFGASYDDLLVYVLRTAGPIFFMGMQVSSLMTVRFIIPKILVIGVDIILHIYYLFTTGPFHFSETLCREPQRDSISFPHDKFGGLVYLWHSSI